MKATVFLTIISLSFGLNIGSCFQTVLSLNIGSTLDYIFDFDSGKNIGFNSGSGSGTVVGSKVVSVSGPNPILSLGWNSLTFEQQFHITIYSNINDFHNNSASKMLFYSPDNI